MKLVDSYEFTAEDEISHLLSYIKTLEATNKALKSQLDIKSNDLADKLDQMRYWKRRAEKLERIAA